MTGTGKARKRDRWIPAAFILFFVALAGLETWFVTIAHLTFSGIVTDNAYAIGLNDEAEKAARDVERQLGWSSELRFDQERSLAGRLTLAVRAADGSPLPGVTVHATAERMTRFPQILPVVFEESSAAGSYVASFTPPLAGRWFIRTTLSKDGKSIRRISHVTVDP